MELDSSEEIIIEDIIDDSIVDLDLYKIYFNDLLEGTSYIKKDKFILFLKNKGISSDDKRLNKELNGLEIKYSF